VDILPEPRGMHGLHNHGDNCGNQNQQDFKHASKPYQPQRGHDLVPSNLLQSLQHRRSLPCVLQLVFSARYESVSPDHAGTLDF
jgi:hypothetical protein